MLLAALVVSATTGVSDGVSGVVRKGGGGGGLPCDGSLPSGLLFGPHASKNLVVVAAAGPMQGRRAHMRVAGVVFASNLVCIIMMRRGEEWGGEERGGEDDYLACPHGFFEIGVARKCRTTTRALGVALGVVDRAAQQSENIQQKEKEVR